MTWDKQTLVRIARTKRNEKVCRYGNKNDICPKIAYETCAKAAKAIKLIKRALVIYECPDCKKWHLASRKKRQFRQACYERRLALNNGE